MTTIKKTALSLLCLVLFSFYIIGCKGDAGPTGPQGIQGNQGNANVHSKIFSITSWTWQTIPVFTPSWQGGVTDNDITQSIIDSGAVMVYCDFGSSSSGAATWNAFPLSEYGGSGVIYSWNYSCSVNQIGVIYSRNNTTQPTVPASNYKYKVVAISASVLSSNPNLNWKDYEEVKAKLNLQE